MKPSLRLVLPAVSASLLAAATAFAVPTSIPFVGELAYTGGAPFEGDAEVTARLYADPLAPDAVYEADLGTVSVSGGILDVVITGGPALDVALEAYTPIYLEFEIDGAVLGPRMEIHSVPYARRAADADSLGGNPAADFLLGGMSTLGELGDVDTGDPGDGEVLVYDASSGSWYAGAWTGSNVVSVDGLGGGTITSDVTVQGIVSGEIRLTDVAAPCDSGKTGTLRWHGGQVEVCNGSAWTALGASASSPAGTAGDPAQSCHQLHIDHPSFPGGAYWIDPDGTGDDVAFQVLCDMDNGPDGGWTICGGYDSHGGNSYRIPGNVFVTSSGNFATDDGASDTHWSINCATLHTKLGATQMIITSDTGDWWSMDTPANLNAFAGGTTYNIGSLNDTTANRSTNTSLTDFRVDWDGSCLWGTHAHQWHIVGPANHTCSGQGEAVGGIHTQTLPDAATDYGDYNTCGDTESDAACADAWIRVGLK